MPEREDTAVESKILDLDLFGQAVRAPKRGPLAERFLMPPFSVLNAREGAWQDRKRSWVAIGLQSEVGREDSPSEAFNFHDDNPESNWGSRGAKMGNTTQSQTGVSIFDPVICELAYRWFCPIGGQIIDPFAGAVFVGS